MKTFKTILCPVDFSDFSANALRYALAISKENEAKLILYHVVPDMDRTTTYMELVYAGDPPQELMKRAKNEMDSFTSEILPAGLEIIKQVEFGPPVEKILDKIKKENVDLVVMGTHGKTGYERFFLGSVTGKILHKTMVPVLTVCKPTHHFIHEKGPRAVEIRKILCALDLSRGDQLVGDLALELARLYQSELSLLHVATKKEGQDWFDRESFAVRKMKYLVGPDQDWCKVRYLVENGRPGEEIMKAVERHGIDLLVMGHHTHLPVQEAVLGSVALKAIAGSTCPVLVLRS
jgi:nucleotide-binding universal stress UspA family protein